jgi:L-ascorbate metabolism protein UlaG (beta-lactamase superfamily)
MEIVYFGQSCFRLKGKSATVVTDPYGEKVGKFPKDVEAEVVTVSHDHFDHNAVERVGGKPFVVNGPGEYESKGVSVIGVPSWHDDKQGQERGGNTIYVIEIDGLRVCHLGDLGHKLTQGVVEEMGPIDILLVPVGGTYTLDAKTSVEVIKQIDPWVAIPMHYGSNEAVKLAPVGEFLKEIGVGEIAAVPKYSVVAEKLPSEFTVVLLEGRV